jgi:hypothetical protein
MSPRPGYVIADLPMSDPTTRDPDFRISPLYGDRCRAVRAALQQGGAL